MPKDNWKPIFANQTKLLEELNEHDKIKTSKLKFNRSYLTVSDISSQFYSEAQLELDNIFGKVKTREQEEGSLLHERMTKDAVAIKFKKMLKTISQADDLAILEALFIMKFSDNFIVGKPDLIIFKKGIPLFLFEYKFSRYSTTYPNQRVQAQIYCQMLKEMGYNTDLLFYGIILAPRDLTKESDRVRNIPREILQRIDLNSLIQTKEVKFEFDQVKVFLYKFDPDKTMQDLNWALKYWRGERKVELSELLRECKRHKHKEKCELTYSIVADLIDKFSSNIISIYGISSFFDRNLPEDWIKNDVDMICVVKDIDKIPKKDDWTEVRRLEYKTGNYIASVFFNSLEGLKDKSVFEKESWANYEWALLNLTTPQNSILLYGQNLADELPNIDTIPFDHEDLLRHAFYHLNASIKLKNAEKSMIRFTKGVFKFSFLLCVNFDKSFGHTSLYEIVAKISNLVEEKKVDTQYYRMLLAFVNYRRKSHLSKELLSLKNMFILHCFSLLLEGKLWKQFSWEEIIQFCRSSYSGLYVLENLAKKQRNLDRSRGNL